MDPDRPMLYFVYAGDNKHEFNYSFKDHSKAKDKYEKLWKESQNKED